MQAMARLTCTDSRVPAFIVRAGDTIGLVRRQQVSSPRIMLPHRQGFEGVSQIQGQFDTREDESWVFVHQGSNWTLIQHADGHKKLLRERGASEGLVLGDSIVFSGSPTFVFGR